METDRPGVRGTAYVRSICSFGHNYDEQIHQLDTASLDQTLGDDDRAIIALSRTMVRETQILAAAQYAARRDSGTEGRAFQLQMMQVDLARSTLEEIQDTAPLAAVNSTIGAQPDFHSMGERPGFRGPQWAPEAYRYEGYNDLTSRQFLDDPYPATMSSFCYYMQYPTMHNMVLYQARQARACAGLDTSEMDK